MNVDALINSNWIKLDDYKTLKDCEYPGVYVLAYSDEDLSNNKIEIEKIFYVGMSNSLGGVKQRLGQFINGIEKDRSHSAGRRFFKEYMNNASFSKNKSERDFYVASLSLPCEVSKGKRTHDDLRKMGEVAMFEFEVVAHIKERLGKEPELNKK